MDPPLFFSSKNFFGDPKKEKCPPLFIFDLSGFRGVEFPLVPLVIPMPVANAGYFEIRSHTYAWFDNP